MSVIKSKKKVSKVVDKPLLLEGLHYRKEGESDLRLEDGD